MSSIRPFLRIFSLCRRPFLVASFGHAADYNYGFSRNGAYNAFALKKWKGIGPNTEPCGTPDVAATSSEQLPFKTTLRLIPVSHGYIWKAFQSTAFETPQLYRLKGVVALLHGTFERPLSGSGVSRKIVWRCGSLFSFSCHQKLNNIKTT